MHICFLNNYLSLRGGSERVMFDEANLLREAGHQVSFFGRRGDHDLEQTHADFYPPAINLLELPWAEKLRHGWQVITNPATARAFNRFLDAVRPQILHAHNIYGGLTTAVLEVARARGLPVVLTAHDYKLVCPSYLALAHSQPCQACDGGCFYQCLRRRCHKSSLLASALYTAEAYWASWGRKYASVQAFLCPSQFMRQRLLDNGFPPDKVQYLPNAVDIEHLQPAYGLGEYALFVGRLSPEKGISTLLRAIEGLPIPLHIVGDGPLREVLAAQVEREGLQAQVTFLGRLTGEKLAAAYRHAAFVVMPSMCYENAPLVALEAYAHGKPLLGSRLGGLPEIIDHEVTGLLFPASDAEALRSCLERLWSEPELWGEWGQAGRRKVESHFSPASHLTALCRIYSSLLPTP